MRKLSTVPNASSEREARPLAPFTLSSSQFTFVPEKTRARAAASVARGVACVLASQVRAGDQLTAWGKAVNEKTGKRGLGFPAGPKGLKIAKEADVTVVLYAEKTVKKTLAFPKGKLTDKAADEVAAAVKEHAAAQK